jgi:hypothetical protein
VGEHLRQQLEPLLLDARVDLTVAGHVHSYFRTCPVADGECARPQDYSSSSSSSSSGAGPTAQQDTYSKDQQRHGIAHFVIGSAGHRLSDVGHSQEAWLAADLQRFGFGRFTVDGASSLVAEFVASEDGEVLDRVELRPTAAREAVCAQQRGAPQLSKK